MGKHWYHESFIKHETISNIGQGRAPMRSSIVIASILSYFPIPIKKKIKLFFKLKALLI